MALSAGWHIALFHLPEEFPGQFFVFGFFDNRQPVSAGAIRLNRRNRPLDAFPFLD